MERVFEQNFCRFHLVLFRFHPFFILLIFDERERERERERDANVCERKKEKEIFYLEEASICPSIGYNVERERESRNYMRRIYHQIFKTRGVGCENKCYYSIRRRYLDNSSFHDEKVFILIPMNH